MDIPRDIIQDVLDLMGEEAVLVIATDEGRITRYARVLGIQRSLIVGDDSAYAIVENYRAEPAGRAITRKTLVDVDELSRITRA